MSEAIKCNICGKFEDGLGYSIRIYEKYTRYDQKTGGMSLLARKVGNSDWICKDCMEEIAEGAKIDIFDRDATSNPVSEESENR